MSDLLIDMGRRLVVCCALVMILGGFLCGFWFGGNALDLFIFGPDISIAGPVGVTPGRLLAGLAGSFLASLAAASTLGLAAAVFDIQQNLHRLSQATLDGLPTMRGGMLERARQEPRLGTALPASRNESR